MDEQYNILVCCKSLGVVADYGSRQLPNILAVSNASSLGSYFKVCFAEDSNGPLLNPQPSKMRLQRLEVRPFKPGHGFYNNTRKAIH